MFIRTNKIKNDELVYLVEGYRNSDQKVKQRIVKRYGLLSELKKDDPNILVKLRKEAKEMESGFFTSIQLNMNATNQEASNSLNYGYFFLDSIYEALKIPMFISNHTRKYNNKYNVNNIMKLLVYARILNPASKKETFESKDKYFDLNCDFSLDDLYRSLSIMNQFKKDLERWVYTQIKEQTGRDTTLVFYDVTNYYFETETEDENTLDDVDEIIEEGLRRKGVSKEHRPEPIVQMGLLIDNNGIPIAYRLFPGNTNDKVTLIPVLNELKEKYELGRVIVVADKGLNSGNNLLYITNNDNGYIVSQQIRKRKKEMIEKVLDEDGYIYNESKTFKIKDWTEEKQVKDQTGNPHILKEKVVSFWSKDFETREKYKRGNLEEIIEKFQKNPKLYTASNAYGVKKYLKEKHVDQETGEIKKKNPILLFDQEKYNRDCALDGYYMIVTSELNLSNEEIIEKYSGLSIIEESFRIIKSDLEGRPVYVWTKEHIEAHFLICFMALVIMRILQKKLDYNYSAQKIQKALSGATCKLITQEIYSLEIQDDTYQDIERVNNVSLNKAYVKKTELKAYQRNVNKK